MWVDFGIYHIFNSEELFNNTFQTLYNHHNLGKSVRTNNVRIGSCVDPRNKYHKDIYKQIAWYFAGGVFGGSVNGLISFADLMKEKCLNIIKEKKHLMWEVNVWYLIYLEHQDLFNIYKCNHNASIITNYYTDRKEK
jgi:hypothetical protein